MKICTFTSGGDNDQHVGVLSNNEVIDISSSHEQIFSSLYSMILATGRENVNLEQLVRKNIGNLDALPRFSLPDTRFKIPLVPSEVWGAGVTYIRSREAREIETSTKGLYSYVYDADRPELFFKTTGVRCVGPEDDVGIRSDSNWSVPEPELSVILGKEGTILGYTIGNDMSARDIEGLSPLYLPQAKIFSRCCSIGPVIATPEDVPDPKSLEIRMKVKRGDSKAFEGSISMSQLKRSVEELVSFLCRCNTVPEGTVLMTGTGIVPPDDFSLQNGDVIEIEIDKIGLLRNKVKKLVDSRPRWESREGISS